MSDKLLTGLVTVAVAILGLAIVAVLVSNQSDTANVFGTAGKSLSQALGCALSPITGAGCGTSVTSTITFG